MKWFIETWAPFDGIAFVTRREESQHDADPELTVALHPPYWDAIAISNAATALRALEHGYQHRLYDHQGEIAFDTLDEVREVVRRGYTGGGLGFAPGPGPGPAPPEGGPDTPVPSFDGEIPGGEGYENVREAMASISTTDRHSAYETLRLYVQSNHQSIEKHHREIAKSYLPWFFSMLARESGSLWRDATVWLFAVEPRHIDDFIQKKRLHPSTDAEWDAYYWLQHAFYNYPWPFGDTYHVSGILNGTFFRVPLRTRWPKVKTFGDLLVAAATSRGFVADLRPPELSLLLFIALIVVQVTEIPSRLRVDRPRDIAAATQWLVDAMPGVLSPTHRAEKVLDRLIEPTTREHTEQAF